MAGSGDTDVEVAEYLWMPANDALGQSRRLRLELRRPLALITLLDQFSRSGRRL